ncbi:MAG: dephospho-CoA kinase, partial [Actinomycetales bacterium]|nr:dephospho-CoA kinase [Actinomycetales bacterium]
MRLIVIAGPAGSGKSTLANSVAEDLGIPHLDFDTVSHEIIEIRRNENPELSEPELLETFKSERYSELAGAIREHSRDLLIASGPFSQHARSPRLWSDWLGECGEVAEVDFIWLHLDPEIRMGRIIGRNSPRDAQVRSR